MITGTGSWKQTQPALRWRLTSMRPSVQLVDEGGDVITRDALIFIRVWQIFTSVISLASSRAACSTTSQ